MNRSRARPRTIRHTALASAIACCFAPALGLANPVGPAVVHGQASFQSQGKSLTVTNAPGTIINWQGFSIGAGETTRFVQQSAASAVLNRVVGRDASTILGALQSNGRVFLVNPNGILIGAGAQIDTAGLIASTLNIKDADFLLGKLRFGDTPGAGPLSNAGEIRTPIGGRVLLISPAGVENSGIIHSPKGEVILAAGKTVELTDSMHPEVRVEISAPDARAVNLGKIVAESGRIGIYGGIVANHGVVSADSAVVGENGKIVFKASREARLEAGSVASASGPSGGSVEVQSEGTTLVAGKVEATGSAAAGGEVHLLGEQVGLIENGSVDVSGDHGGGTALIGGDLQGANPSIQNARAAYTGADTRIKADAATIGDGGKVIVWADETTRSYGAISARGGATGGNGGFVETSGKQGLDVRRGPDVRAPAGKAGTWLLDPVDLEVVAASEFDPATNSGAPFFAPLTDSSRIGVDLINAQLDFGSNVTLTTTSQGADPGAQAGNITISAPIVKTAKSTSDVFIGTTSLTLQAHNNIVIGPDGSITSTGDPLNVTLQAYGSVTLAGPLTGNFISANASGGALTVAAPITSTSSVSLTGRDGVAIAGGVNIATGPFSIFSANASGVNAPFDIGPGATVSSRGAFLTADAMNIQGVVNANTGSITVRPSTAGRGINLGTETGGALSITQAEFNNLQTTGSLTIGSASAGPITVNGPIVGSPAFLSLESGTSYAQNAGVNVSSSLFIDAPSITIAAPLAAAGTNGITLFTDTLALSSSVTASAGPLDIYTWSSNRPIALGISMPSGSALELTDSQLDMLVTPGVLRFSTDDAINIAGAISPAGAATLSLNSYSGSVMQAVNAPISVSALAVYAGGSIDLPAPNGVGTFAAETCCSTANINFVAAPNKLLTIGTVDGTSGVTVSNFSGTGNIMLQADDLNIAAGTQVRTNIGDVKIQPNTTTVTLGGDVGSTLSLNAAEVSQLQGTRVLIQADEIDIVGPVTFSAATTVLGPQTIDRAVKIVNAKVDPTANEFLPSELSNITAGTVVLGGDNAGPVSVQTPTSVPGTIGKLVLHSGGTASSVTVGLSMPLSAINSIGITADTVDLQAGVSTTNGNIDIATHTPGRRIEIGTDTGASLGLGLTEIGLLSASAPSTISFTSAGGNIDVTGIVDFPSASIALDAGGTFTLLAAQWVSAGGRISVRAPVIDIQGMTRMIAVGPEISLLGNTIDVGSAASVTSGLALNIAPRDPRPILLGTAGTGAELRLDNSELQALNAPGILRIGDESSVTGNITLTAPISLPNRTLSLKTSAGEISQSAGATLTASNLAAKAFNNITMNEANQVGTVALHSDLSAISFTRASGAALAVGSVDGLTGVFAGAGQFATPMPVTLRADQINIDQQVRGSTVTLLPSAGGDIDIGARSGFGFDQADLNRIVATSVVIGESTSADVTVSAPINVTTFNDLTLIGGSAGNVNGTLTVPGNFSITSGSLATTAAVTSTGGDVTFVTDALTLGAAVNAFGTITVQPLTGMTRIDLGGADAAGVLGIAAADMNQLNAPLLVFGATPRVDISAPISTTRSVALITDDLTIPDAGIHLTASDLSVTTVTNGRTIDLGTAGVGTFMGLDAATLGKLSIANSLSFAAPGASTLIVSAPVTIPAADLTLSARTLNFAESLAVNGDLILRVDTPLSIAAGKTLSSTGGNIEIANRTAGAMTFGAGGIVGSTHVPQLMTSSFLVLGDALNTTSLSIAQALDASAFGGLLLRASGNISQTAGSTITAPQLGIQSGNGSVTLTENNVVNGAFSGYAGAFGSFSFKDAGTLVVGTVDGIVGITASSGTVVLRADALDIQQPVSASSVTLAPRLANTAINLGTDTGFGITDAEIDRISAFSLTVGDSTSGPITVSAPVDRSTGSLSLLTASGSSIAVNAALSVPSALSMNAGTGSVTLAAPVTASSSIDITANTIFVNGDLTSSFSSVDLIAPSGSSASSVTVNNPIIAGSSITITADDVALNAMLDAGFAVTLAPRSNGRLVSVGMETPGAFSISSAELGLIDASQVTIGSSAAGDLTVNAPIGPFPYANLTLRSGGNVTETPGSTITMRVVDPNNARNVSGALNVTAGGQINLPEANDVASSVSGRASGTANDFVFNNISPLKLQNVSGVFASGKVLIRTATPPSAPTSPNISSDAVANALLSDLYKSPNVQKDVEKASEYRKEEAEKKERAEDKEKGRSSCS